MSLQWSIVSAFLFGEIFFISLLLMPLISSKKWRELFDLSAIRYINQKSQLFFVSFILILLVFLLDAVRESTKYLGELDALKTDINREAQFQAQRNLFISGVSLFLWLVIRRLIVLISNTAELSIENNLMLQENERLKADLFIFMEAKMKKDAESVNPSLVQEDIIADKNIEEIVNAPRSRSRSKTKKEE